ncbi:sulfated surface glycoprotein 185-like [Penaeus monodon]|uniref:sulfated surface glycoprotein 185-like n=1 Tax=Penaeus monodon TaxID=6687 RepID=UPI0018A71EBA|nr:sulfated surface glycoprotein 185-like [Penaeus monodon]
MAIEISAGISKGDRSQVSEGSRSWVACLASAAVTLSPPQTPESPSPPQTPESPSPPQTPESPSPPQTPESPSPPQTPESPSPPQTPESPSPPQTPESPSPPQTPESPSAAPSPAITIRDLGSDGRWHAIYASSSRVIATNFLAIMVEATSSRFPGRT